ncbi:hypothetical protein SH528x_002362 [Novipirellula sp. SH528]|uniref:hypothetical protein n=1 Tax=Novipirellula sp. SH528 TaxID=3454466 RepID=UPI003FA14341
MATPIAASRLLHRSVENVTETAVVDMSHRSRSTSEPSLQSPSANAESVCDIIARLGPPPRDVVDVWCQQASAIAEDIHARTGQPLPPINLADWLVDSHGTVGLRSTKTRPEDPVSSDAPSHHDVRAINEQRLEEFRNQVGGELSRGVTALGVTALGVTALGESNANVSQTNQPDQQSSLADVSLAPEEAPSRNTSRRRQPNPVVAIATVGIIGITLGLVWWWNSGTSHPEKLMVADTGVASQQFERDTKSPVIGNDTPDSNTDSVLQTATLESFDTTSDELNSGSTLANPKSLLEFDSLVPSMMSSNFETSQSSTADADPNSFAEQAQDAVEGTAAAISIGDVSISNNIATDALSIAPEIESPEIPQTVRSVAVHAIELPATDDTATSQSIENFHFSNDARDRLLLEFPINIPIAMIPSREIAAELIASYDIRDTRNETSIAVLNGEAEGLRFQWNENAKASSQASSLLHGRLRDVGGDVVFFRPRIEADAWTLSFEKSDFHPSWNLSGMLPTKVARLKIEFELPDEVEEAWIEPIDSTSPRRTSGIAVLSLKDSENVRIGIRFDIKCTTKLSCQIRTAGRLDPTFAWQSFTETGLANFANALLGQTDQLLQQVAQVESLYDRSDTDARRIIRPRRAAMKSHVDHLTEMSRRVAELQSLVTLLQTSAKLRFEVSVQWADMEQVILTQKD